MPHSSNEPPAALPFSPPPPLREVRYRASENFAEVLARLGGSLLVSTYQAGKLVVIGLHAGQVAVGLTNFEQAMGIAVAGDQLAVSSRGRFWFLRRAPGIGPQLEPPGRFDQCWMTRSGHVTGPIDGHELAWLPGDASGELWIANTLFSCLCTLDDRHSFVPRWRPPFVSALAAEDRCHLNGLAADDGQIRYVTARARVASQCHMTIAEKCPGPLLRAKKLPEANVTKEAGPLGGGGACRGGWAPCRACPRSRAVASRRLPGRPIEPRKQAPNSGQSAPQQRWPRAGSIAPSLGLSGGIIGTRGSISPQRMI